LKVRLNEPAKSPSSFDSMFLRMLIGRQPS
jgi:hypothetical protein